MSLKPFWDWFAAHAETIKAELTQHHSELTRSAPYLKSHGAIAGAFASARRHTQGGKDPWQTASA